MPRNYYKSGDWNAICDRCGFKFKGSMLKEEWNGWMTCSSCFEQKHPSLMQRVPTETSMPNFSRPEQVDQFTSLPPPPPPPGPPAPPPATDVMPDFIEPLVRHPVDWLQVGDYIWMDGRWGFASTNPGVDPDLTEGPNDYNFMQLIGRCRTTADDGSVAGRWQIRWPFVNSVGHTIAGNLNYSEVKTYPSVLFGHKPGFFGSSMWPSFVVANRKPDGGVEPVPNPSFTPSNIAIDWQPQGGTVDQTFPSGGTPGTGSSVMPLQLPLTGKTCKVRFKFKEYAPPTGSGHLSFDIWLTQTGPQIQGHVQSSLTHEIMIPIRYWGTPGYGSYPNRNPSWYDHDITIDGVLYHVYCTKRLSRNDATGNFDGNPGSGLGYYPGLRYNFGGLDPVNNYINEETGVARLGWKLIVFEPDVDHHPVDSNGFVNLNIANFLAHLATQVDERGVHFIRNTEFLQSLELGIEQVVGTSDIAPYYYKVLASNSVVAMPPEPPTFVPPPPPPPPAPPPPPPPPPPPAPPAADSTIQAFFTAGKVGWWGKVTTLSDFVEDESVGTAPADFTKLVGRWKNHGNLTDGHDMIQTNNTLRCALGTDSAGVGAHYVSGFIGQPMHAIGGATTDFYGCFAVNITTPSYDATLFSDSTGTNNGIKLAQEAFNAIMFANFGTGAATVTCQATYAAGSNNPAGRILVEIWRDSATGKAGIRVNKGTPDEKTCAAISAGSVDAFTWGKDGAGGEQMAAQMFEGLFFKAFCPSQTDRDLIASDFAYKAGVFI